MSKNPYDLSNTVPKSNHLAARIKALEDRVRALEKLTSVIVYKEPLE